VIVETEAPVGISYSGGASSRWLIDAVLNGELARPDNVAVFFADTGDEHRWTYDDVDLTEERCAAAGIPFFRTAHHETLSAATLSATRGERKRLDTPPFWVENQGGGRGQLRQQCTVVWKTSAIRRSQTAWLQSIGMPKKIVTWIGFGSDEQHRAVKAAARRDVQWVTLDFPAIRAGKTRAAQRADIERWGMDAPLFSMCVQCPYKTPKRWFQTAGVDLEKAIEIDEAIRHGLEKIDVDNPVFLSDRLIPVERLVKGGDPQPNLPGIEVPGCDSGSCFL